MIARKMSLAAENEKEFNVAAHLMADEGLTNVRQSTIVSQLRTVVWFAKMD
jgi:hypothetical protein